MIRTIKTWLCRMFGHTTECQHEWKRTRACIRECQLCGREEALFYNRFARYNEPALTWRASPDQCCKESIEMLDDWGEKLS